MRQILCAMLLVGGVAATANGQGAPPPAPPPGSAATYKAAQDLADVLRRAAPTAGGMTTSAVANTDQYRINIVHRAKPAGAIAHAGNTELHYIIDGTGTLVTGGTIVRGVSATVEQGETRKVTQGDVIVIPAGSPHWYSAIDSTITYLEVRWLAPVK